MNFIYRLVLTSFITMLVLLTCANGQESITLGDERSDVYIPLLKGKRVGLFSNQSGIVGDRSEGLLSSAGCGIDDKSALIPFGATLHGRKPSYGPHIVDCLLNEGIDVRAIFSPEHGFRGIADAGENVSSGIDEKTGIPIYSLYGKRSWQLSEKIALIDVLVIDIQDVGLRYYTYYISMLSLMEECAKMGKDVVLLDRPNPNGFYIGGPVLSMDFKSGVGSLPIATAHGLTLGELAYMANEEGWLEGGVKCNLYIVKCLGYTHSTKYRLLMSPSPNLKDMKAIYLYASTCYFEGTNISLGRGTAFPFEVYGAPQMSGDYEFTPRSVQGAKNPPYKDKLCYGTSLREMPLEDIFQKGVHYDFIIDAYNRYSDKDHFFIGGGRFFDLLSGTDRIRKMIEAGESSETISHSWEKELQDYADLRNKYLLYPL